MIKSMAPALRHIQAKRLAGQVRKLNALRKLVGHAIAEEALVVCMNA